jgi:twitching motility protein PilT
VSDLIRSRFGLPTSPARHPETPPGPTAPPAPAATTAEAPTALVAPPVTETAPVPPATSAPSEPAAYVPLAPVRMVTLPLPVVPLAEPNTPAVKASPAASPNVLAAPDPTYDRDAPVSDTPVVLDDLLLALLAAGGSDLHLTQNAPPTIRLRGDLTPLHGYAPLRAKQLQELLYGVMTERQRKEFEEELELDFAYAIPGYARFRVNIFQQREATGAVMRLIPWEIKALDDLGMPSVITSFTELKRGLVLVTGATGSGKSTTLAAMIDRINRTTSGHIVTIEDPIEFLHEHQRCIVNQREVGEDTHGFQAALKHVLRQDPDVILVGELRDLETIQVALTAAETGHLVFATLHTQSAQDTISRLVDVFPAGQQQQIRTQVAATLQGVVCQNLVKTADGHGRVAAVEVMVCNPGIRAMIRDDKLQQIQGSLQAGAREGMQTLNAHLASLVKSGRITYEAGLEVCSDRNDFETLVKSSSVRPSPGWS